MMMKTETFIGKVILAGAGPGDPELITLKAIRFLQEADVVITDRLVSESLIVQYAKPGAEIIYVGKQAGQSGSTRQDTINELLVNAARRHAVVLRLKGGDVTFFSNVFDELRTLVAHGIPYEIVPGVTAASGAAAYAGIPLTARGYASGVRFLTFYQSVEWPENVWSDLSKTDDTLVFYMSVKELKTLVDQLMIHGVASEKGIAIIEQATTPLQRVTIFSFADFYKKSSDVSFASPALLIVGRVTALHQEFKWIENYAETELYFRPVNEQVEKQLAELC